MRKRGTVGRGAWTACGGEGTGAIGGGGKSWREARYGKRIPGEWGREWMEHARWGALWMVAQAMEREARWSGLVRLALAQISILAHR